MKNVPQRGTREAAGCFCMLILAALLTLGAVAIILPGAIAALAGKPPAGFGRSVLIWLAAPAAGIALVGWLTYGFRRREAPRRRR